MNNLKNKLIIGAKIKIGPKYAKGSFVFDAGDIITLEEGHFWEGNGLYETELIYPVIWNKYDKEWDSIYHLFENDLSGFEDCEVIE